VVTGERLGSREIEFGGPDTLTFNQLAAIVQDVAGRRATVRHIRRPVLRAMSLVARPLNPQLARQSRGAVVLDTIDMNFDPGPVRREFPDLPETSVREALKSCSTARRRRSREAATLISRCGLTPQSGRPDLNRRPLDPSHLLRVAGRGWIGLTEHLSCLTSRLA